MRRIAVVVAVAVVVGVGCGFDGAGGAAADGGAVPPAGLTLPDGAMVPEQDASGTGDGSVVGPGGEGGALDAAAPADAGPPICGGGQAFCAPSNSCVMGCGDNTNCTATNTCWTCGPGGTGARRQVCSSTSCNALGSACHCATSTDCPDDEICGPARLCLPCNVTQSGQTCGNSNKCILCAGGGAQYRCAPGPDQC